MEDLILDLTLILVVAGAVTLIFKRLKQPLVLGYIVAGFLVSPHMPYLPMTKTHYISFLAAVSDQGVQFVKLYPEGGAETRFKINRVERIYACCNRHGLFMLDLKPKRKSPSE